MYPRVQKRERTKKGPGGSPSKVKPSTDLALTSRENKEEPGWHTLYPFSSIPLTQRPARQYLIVIAPYTLQTNPKNIV